jgi:ABC-2 type transport system permease protein
MKKLWVLIRREYAQVVKKKSFLIGVLLTPLLMAGMTVLPAMLAMKKQASTEKIAIIDLDGQGIGEKFKSRIAHYRLDDSSAAYEVDGLYELDPNDSASINNLRKELDSLILAKRLKCYLVINKSAEMNDSIFLVAKSFNFNTNNRFERRISDVLSGIRLEKSNINLAVDSVLTLTRRIDLKTQSPGGKERDFKIIYFTAIGFVMIIFVTAIGYGQILMRSVIEEKNSRIIEIMVSSVSAFQLMAGKIIGLGLATLTQVGIWLVIGVAIYSYRGVLDISPEAMGAIFNPIIIGFFIIFLILGYIMYSTIFAFIGAICNTEKEAQNFIFPITMSLILPLLLAMYIIQEPDSTVSTILSLIPFFTPTMMILRLNIIGPDSFSLHNPIILESMLGVILTAAAIVAIIWATARIFRIGILMYGKRPTLPEIIRWIRY